MVWYSQEARAYGLLILTSAVALGFFAETLRRRGPRMLAWWAVFSALSVLTHYFAVFTIAPEALALLLLLPELRRRVIAAIGGVLVVCAALVPLAVHQASLGHDVWISSISFGTRLSYLVKQFVFGYHGSSAAILSVLVLGTLGAFALVAGRALWRAPNPRWRLPLWIGVATMVVAR